MLRRCAILPGMTHIDVPPGRAAQSLWCDRNWHDGACCPGSIQQWHQDHDLLPPEPKPDPASLPAWMIRAMGDQEPSGLDTTAAGWSWAVPAHERGDHSACNRNCEHTL
jgi:hypothetical protein